MEINLPDESLAIAHQWCRSRGAGWEVIDRAGRGGTAPVYAIRAANGGGEFALKIYDAAFSTGDKGRIEEERVNRQLSLGRHNCPSLIQVFDGGWFENRLYLLMNRAPGHELEKVLHQVPRSRIGGIVDQVARAALFLRQHGLSHRDIKSANVVVSPDFAQATLIDLSVTRDIYDPVGIGTDHDGQLPIVATARYSPPEYLFRLIEPSEELWHALDVYQLGGLLYDLIERETLFQDEFLRSKENRYRFAWIVATAQPQFKATDVDADLLFLARRALDKDWKRRSSIKLEDFFAEAQVNKRRAFAALGIGGDVDATASAPERDLANLRTQLRSLVVILEDRIREYLQSQSVTCKHSRESAGSDLSAQLLFAWLPRQGDAVEETEFRVLIRLVTNATVSFACTVKLTALVGGERRSATIELPEAYGSADAATQLGEQCEAALPELAILLTRARSEVG